MKKTAVLFCSILFLGMGTIQAQYTDLLNFTGGSLSTNPGQNPQGSLTPSVTGDTLFGMTEQGGAYFYGNVFMIKKDGTGYRSLYDLGSQNTNDGYPYPANPYGSLTRIGSTLYGMTATGGFYEDGNVFSYNFKTNTYTDLYDMLGPYLNYPTGSFTQIGNSLYALTQTADGQFVSFNLSTNTYTPLFYFTGLTGSYPGGAPQGSLVASGNIVYGVTPGGGSHNYGVIFSYNISTNTYNVLYNFYNENPSLYGALALKGNVLYGTTQNGDGTNSFYGTIFSYDLNTNTYTDFYKFTPSTGAGPYGSVSLSVSGDTLFGLAYTGGTASVGTIFGYDLVQNLYTNLYSFTSATGANPMGGTVLQQGNTLYGMTYTGGSSGDGVIFKYVISLSAKATLVSTVNCNGGTNGKASSTVSGGITPYTYNWNPSNQTNSTATGLSAGTYTLTVTDNAGSSSVSAVTISQPLLLTASIAQPNNPTCNGFNNGSAVATVSGGSIPYTYSWTPAGGNTANGTGLTAGSYTLTVKDKNGCIATATVSLTQPTQLLMGTILPTVNNIICLGGYGSATVGPATGGTPPYTYSWSLGFGTNLSANNLYESAYTITATDNNGCTATTSISITQPAQLSAAVASVTNPQCYGGNGSISVTVSGGTSPYHYSWKTGSLVPLPDTGLTLSNVAASSYVFYVSDSHGCLTDIITTITQPAATVIAGISKVINASCNGTNNGSITAYANGGSSPYTYLWNGGNGTNLTATGLSIGTYTITITDNHGCSSFASAIVNNSFVSSATVSANVLCNGASTGNASVAIVSPVTGIQYFSFVPVVQHFVVPSGVSTLTIAISGAAGGYNGSGINGKGASFTGICPVTPGDILGVVVGQQPGNSGSNTPGGGGASWIYDSNTVASLGISSVNPIAVAGGGGSTSIGGGRGAVGGNGGIDIITYAATNGAYQNGAGGTGGHGGAAGVSSLFDGGGGGAGWLSSGATSSGGNQDPAGGGKNFTTPGHFAGGTGGAGFNGGYGGGGGAGEYGGGGGGGYNGGGGGDDYYYDESYNGGGGGGSYLNGTVIGAPVDTNQANGIVTITWNSSAASLPYTYSWSTAPVQTNSNVTGLSAGTYTITVANDNGCTSATSVTITQPPVLGISFSTLSNVLCNGGNTGSLSSVVSGGISPYTYSWLPNGGSNSIASGLSVATYTINVTDHNGCIATATTTITQPAVLSATASAISNEGCNGGSTGIVSSGISGGVSPYIYSWSSGGGSNSTASGLSAGTYTITATDSHGCTATASATISQPTFQLGITIASKTDVLCIGGTGTATANLATGGTSPYTYSWSGAGGTNSTTLPVGAGTYTITVKDNNGCTANALATITQPSAPLGVAIQSVTGVNCNLAGTATAHAASGGTSPYTYSWSSGGGTNLTATGFSTGTYTITVTDNHGCSAIASATILQTVSVIGITISTVTNVSCMGGTGSATATAASGGNAPYTYSWSGLGGTNLRSLALVAGTYTLAVTDNHGCSATVSATITQPAGLGGIIISASANSCQGGNNGTASVLSPIDTTYVYKSVVQHFPVPAGLTSLSITVTGASGDSYGGNGASFTGICSISPGNILSIVSAEQGYGNVGGGGSFVFDSNTINLLAVAAGGGGEGLNGMGGPGGTDLINNSCASINGSGVSGTGGNGGNAGLPSNSVYVGSGGAGWHSNGQDADSALNFVGGIGMANDFGTSSYDGGYGGGGAGGIYGGGGGGGYNGGGGGNEYYVDINGFIEYGTGGAGGGSYLNGILVGTPTANNHGNGYVTLQYNYGGTLPYTYLWSDANHQTTATATGLSGGTYTITITDAHGCSITSSVNIGLPTSTLNVTPSITTGITCNGASTGSISSLSTGGVPPYSYSWSPGGGTNSSISGLSAGTYTLVVKDNCGASMSSFIPVTQPALLTANSSVYQESTACTNSGEATASQSGGVSPYTYLWSDAYSQTASVATGLSSGSYTITVTDANNCIANTTVTITQPAVLGLTTSVLSNVNCNGASNGSATVSVSGGTLPYSYSWNNGNSTGINNNLSAGTYTVTITDANNCIANTTITITQPAILGLATSVTSNVNCNGANSGSTTATVSGGTLPYSYSWNNGIFTATNSNLSAGTYTVTITDANNCAANTTVIISQPTTLELTTSVTSNVNCNGANSGSATATVSGGTLPYSYSWNNGNSTGINNNLSAGTYTVTITDANNCAANTTITITQPAILGLATSVTSNVNCNGANSGSATATVSGGTLPYSYSWNNGIFTATNSNLSAGTYTVTITDANNCAANTTVIISQPTTLGLTTSVTSNVNCNSGNNGSANAAATGGVLPYTYNWSNGETTASAIGLSAGTYTLTLKDANLCFSNATVIITQPAVLTVSFGGSMNAGCNGSNNGSLVANTGGGSSPYTYSWSNGNSSSSLTALSAGTYIVTITDVNGCTASSSATITQTNSLTSSITVISHENCNGGISGSVTATSTGGSSPYTYSWSPTGGSSATASGLSAGSYTVHVTDHNGCTASHTVTITQPSILSTTASVTTEVSCNGGSTGKASATTSGGSSPYTYSWSPNGGSNVTASALSAGSYTVHVTDHNGCTVSHTVTITQPSILSTIASVTTEVSCNGGSTGKASATTSGGSSPYTYSWSPNGGSNVTASALSAGSYTVHVTDHNGCTVSHTVTITQPSILNTTASVTTEVSCNGGSTGKASATISGGSSPYTYSWSPRGGSNAAASGLSAGTYTVHITDHSGCTTSHTVTITQPSILSVSANIITEVSCNGGSTGKASTTISGGSSPYTYSWSPRGGSNAAASGLSAGTYTVHITDHSGCTTSHTVTITQPSLLSASISSSSCINGRITAAMTTLGGVAPYTYSWSPCGLTKATVSGLSAGTYVIKVTDHNGCSVTVSDKLSCGSLTASPVQPSDSVATQCCPAVNINLYPNPNTGQFTVTGIEKGMLLEIYDYMGRKINTIKASDEAIEINISNQPNAVYLIRILDKYGNLVSEKKAIKTH